MEYTPSNPSTPLSPISAQPSGRRRRLFIIAVLAVAVLVTVIFGVRKIQESFIQEVSLGTPAEPASQTASSVPENANYPAPDFSLTSIGASATTVHLFDLRSRPVVLLFFASWNENSVDALRLLAGLYHELVQNGVSVVAIANLESPENVGIFAERGQLQMPIFADGDGKVGEDYHLSTLPAFFFVGRDGIVKEMHVGTLSRDDVLVKALRLNGK